MKDPAALLYIDKWVASTRGMTGSAKGWYMDLILYQFDKGSIPNDIDEMASICSVRPSEYDLFEQVFEQVLQQKFEQNDEQRLENPFAREILQKRQLFKDKRSNAGKMSYLVKFAKSKGYRRRDIEVIKENINIDDIDFNNQTHVEQVLNKCLNKKTNTLNEDVDEDINKDDIEKDRSSKFNYNDFINLFNQISNRSFKGDKKSENQFKAREKDGYTIDEFKKAIGNLYKSEFHKENNFQHATPEFITRSDKLQKYLNVENNQSNTKNTQNKKFNNLKVNDLWKE
jgi:uncharacterized phage protein (TIGR02220 family)